MGNYTVNNNGASPDCGGEYVYYGDVYEQPLYDNGTFWLIYWQPYGKYVIYRHDSFDHQWRNQTSGTNPIGTYDSVPGWTTGNPIVGDELSSSSSSTQSENSSSSSSEHVWTLIGYLNCDINGSTNHIYWLPLYDHYKPGSTPSDRDFWGDINVLPNNLAEAGFLSMDINGDTKWMHVYTGDPGSACCTNLEGTWRSI